MGTRCANHVTPLYPQKLALTSPTGGGRSVDMVRSRTKATEFSFSFSDGHVRADKANFIGAFAVLRAWWNRGSSAIVQ